MLRVQQQQAERTGQNAPLFVVSDAVLVIGLVAAGRKRNACSAAAR